MRLCRCVACAYWAENDVPWVEKVCQVGEANRLLLRSVEYLLEGKDVLVNKLHVALDMFIRILAEQLFSVMRVTGARLFLDLAFLQYLRVYDTAIRVQV